MGIDVSACVARGGLVYTCDGTSCHQLIQAFHGLTEMPTAPHLTTLSHVFYTARATSLELGFSGTDLHYFDADAYKLLICDDWSPWLSDDSSLREEVANKLHQVLLRRLAARPIVICQFLNLRGWQAVTIPPVFVRHTINLEDSAVEYLPDNPRGKGGLVNLYLNGSLYLNRSKIKRLPKGLIACNGNLYIENTDIEELPADLQFNSIHLNGSKVTHIPKGITCPIYGAPREGVGPVKDDRDPGSIRRRVRLNPPGIEGMTPEELAARLVKMDEDPEFRKTVWETITEPYKETPWSER